MVLRYALTGVAVLVSTLGCSNPELDRIKRTTKPTYDKESGKLVELTYDRDKNGTIDTWTEMNGSRLLSSRSDLDEDGTLDRWEYYDERGHVTKVGFARARDGRLDAWAFTGPDGRVARVEIASTGDPARIDRWEHYDEGVLARAEEDTNGDGRPDKTEAYESGSIATAAMDEDGDGRPDRRLTYSAGSLVLIESEPDASGAFRRSVRPR